MEGRLQMRPEIIKALEENIGGKLHNIDLDNHFMVIIPEAYAKITK